MGSYNTYPTYAISLSRPLLDRISSLKSLALRIASAYHYRINHITVFTLFVNNIHWLGISWPEARTLTIGVKEVRAQVFPSMDLSSGKFTSGISY